MGKLKLAAIQDDKPVKMTVEIAATVRRDLDVYAETLAADTGQRIDPAKLVGPMLARFMETDRAFLKARKTKLKRTDQEA